MKLEKFLNPEHNIIINGRDVNEFAWQSYINEITIPTKITFKVCNIDLYNIQKISWNWGDGTKVQIITNRNKEPGRETPTHYFRPKNIKNNATINIQISAVNDKFIFVSPPFAMLVQHQRQNSNYVDPEEFKQQIIVYYKTGVMIDEIAIAVQEIATRLSFAPNFINYSYREEMVGDALIKMIKALNEKKFDPDKGNPFSYFTKIAYHAFCKRIKGEKRIHSATIDYQNEVYDNLINDGVLPPEKSNSSTYEYETD